MPELEDALAEALRRDTREAKLDFAQISSLQADGTVNLRFRGVLMPGVPRVSGSTLVAGDWVALTMTDRGWLVQGKLAGSLSLTSAGTQIAVVDQAGYQNNTQSSAYPAQGVDDSGYSWTGAWVYGTTLRTRLASAYTTVKIYLERDKETWVDERAQLLIGLHSSQVLPLNGSVPLLSNITNGPYLEPGEGVWWQLSSALDTALKNGPSYGIGITSDRAESYLVMSSDSGRVAVN